jgi:phospholipid/cholesterol/gamma-HCH transport system substrate-binding protein
MNSYEKAVWVGVMVAAAVVVFLGGALWLTGKNIGHADAVVLYSDIGDLKAGSPVGRVSDITYLNVGRVAVSIAFAHKRHITVTSNASAAITSVGMLGDAVVAFNPGTGTPIGPNDTIRGTLAPGLFDKAGGVVNAASTTMVRLDSMLDPRLVTDLRATLASSRKAMEYFADPKAGPTSQVNATMLALQATSKGIDSLLASTNPRALQARLDTTMKSAGNAADRLATMTAHMDSLVMLIQKGNGTMGKLMTDSTLYVDLRHTLQATTDLINALAKNPGKLGITVRIP